MASADDPLADLSAEEQRALVDLAKARVDGRVNRRDVLFGGAGAALGAAGLAGLTQGGAAQPTGDEGSVGTQSNRVEAWISEADANEIDADEVVDGAGVSHTGELADDGDSQPPEQHANTHENGGADELDAADLSGASGADGQVLTSTGSNAQWEAPAGAGAVVASGTVTVQATGDAMGWGVTNDAELVLEDSNGGSTLATLYNVGDGTPRFAKLDATSAGVGVNHDVAYEVLE